MEITESARRGLRRALSPFQGRDRALAVMVLAIALVLPSGCAPKEPPADLVILNGKEPESLDPAIFSGQPDGRAGTALFEGLTRYDPVTAAAVPGLAERWDVSSDGRVYRFVIRERAAWSTGEPVTAADFVYSWLRVLRPETGCDYAGILFYVQGAEAFAAGATRDPATVAIRALDDRRLEVRLIHPTPFFLELCAYPSLAALPRRSIEQHGDRWLLARPLPVSGAYTLGYWRLNDRIRLIKNPRYWDAAHTLSGIVDLLPVSNPNTALNLYETAQADVIWDKELVPTELLDVLRKRPDFHTFNYLASYFVRFNVTRPPFNDRRVRQALTRAIDRPRLVARVTAGGERAISHLVPIGVPGYTSPEGLPHDPQLARRLLAEAGFPGGRGFPRVRYLFNSGRDHERLGVELQAAWKQELGIDIELRSLEWKVYFRAQTDLDYDLCRASWVGDYSDANTFLDLFLSNNPNNRTGWTNSLFDQILTRANAEPDPATRIEGLRQAEAVLIREDPPIMPLYNYVGFNFWDPRRIEGIHNNLRDEHPIRAIRRRPTR